MDVSGGVLRAWITAIHAGMMEDAGGQKCRQILSLVWRDAPLFPCSADERKLMTHFVVESHGVIPTPKHHLGESHHTWHLGRDLRRSATESRLTQLGLD